MFRNPSSTIKPLTNRRVLNCAHNSWSLTLKSKIRLLTKGPFDSCTSVQRRAILTSTRLSVAGSVCSLLISTKKESASSAGMPSSNLHTESTSVSKSRNMVTAFRIDVSAQDAGTFHVEVTEDAARKVSEVLQQNMERYHITYNSAGFHNHIVHHILTIYALGASADEIQAAYDRDSRYQKPAKSIDEAFVEGLHDREIFKKHLHQDQHYPNYLTYFQREIDRKGVPDVLNEYLFAEDGRADELLLRMFAGLLHPIIHLGFGIEFNQPAIVAEALAQACIHDDWIDLRRLLPEAEKAAGGVGKTGTKTLFQLLDEIRADENLGYSQGSTLSFIRRTLPPREPDDMLKYISQFTVAEDQLEEKLAEMMNAVIYYTAAAQEPHKFDFVCVHTVNSSIFFSFLLEQHWLSMRTKMRLLEWKSRMDLMVYVAQRTPPLSMPSITGTTIRKQWPEIFHEGCIYGDDGHTPKLIRAVAHAEQVCRAYEGKSDWRIHGDMWLKIGNLIIN